MSDIQTLAILVLGGAFDATELGENDIQPASKLIEELQQRLVTDFHDVYIELINRADLDRVTAERDALQLRLNAADQRIDELTSKPGSEAPVCRGSPALGTACGKCVRCLAPPGEVKFKGMIETTCGTFAIMIDEANAHYGWTFMRHPDGMWVSGRKATEAEMQAARRHAQTSQFPTGVHLYSAPQKP